MGAGRSVTAVAGDASERIRATRPDGNPIAALDPANRAAIGAAANAPAARRKRRRVQASRGEAAGVTPATLPVQHAHTQVGVPPIAL